MVNSLTQFGILITAAGGFGPVGAFGEPIPQALRVDSASGARAASETDPLTQQLGGGPDNPMGPGFDLNWFTIDGGGATFLTGGGFSFGTTVGQPDAGFMVGGDYELGGGYWYGVIPTTPCYANCDDSTIHPVLNVNDFSCFLNRYAAGDSYANCDQSTLVPALNVNDFSCFLNRYAAGCP